MNFIDKLIGPVFDVINKVVPDQDKARGIAFELATMAEKHTQELAKGQLEVNKVEAASDSMFVAGWRPMVGWTCCAGMAMSFILIPMANVVLALTAPEIVLPLIDLSAMMPVLLGMLGLGGLRTYEKVKQVSREK